jgi:hypothetical protein
MSGQMCFEHATLYVKAHDMMERQKENEQQ